MADILSTIGLVVLAALACVVLFFILKNGLKLVFKLLINAVAGILILLLLTGLKIIPAIGDITLVKVIICAVGGVFGALVIVVLSFFGITL